MIIKVLNTGLHSGSYNLALDETLVDVVAKSKTPILRLYGWNNKIVTLGYFQEYAQTLNTDLCLEDGVEIVRRMTGGSACICENVVSYSLIIPEESELVRSSITDSYIDICKALLEVGALLGLQFNLNALNQIFVNDLMIANNFQSRFNGVILQQGNLFLKPVLEHHSKYIKTSTEDLAYQGLFNNTNFTDLETQLNKEINFQEITEVLFKGFKLAFKSCKFELAELNKQQEDMVLELVKSKYSTDSWNQKI